MLVVADHDNHCDDPGEESLCIASATGCAAPTYYSSSISTTHCASQPHRYACAYCPCGQYQNQTGQSSCTVCEAGTWKEDVDDHCCTACAAGRFLADDGVSASAHDRHENCTVCPVGKFGAAVKSASCANCPESKYQLQVMPGWQIQRYGKRQHQRLQRVPKWPVCGDSGRHVHQLPGGQAQAKRHGMHRLPYWPIQRCGRILLHCMGDVPGGGR